MTRLPLWRTIASSLVAGISKGRGNWPLAATYAPSTNRASVPTIG
jgi:hypothetical protein